MLISGFFFALSLLPFSAPSMLNPLQEAEQYAKSLIIGQNSGYDKTVRPEYITTLYVLMFLKQIISIDEKNQVMTSSVNCYVSWLDLRLDWNVSDINITFLTIPAKALWLPDLVIANSADSDVFLKLNDNNYALVDNYGYVNVIYSLASLRTRCEMDVRNFPFDQQNCSISLSSWTHSSSMIKFINGNTGDGYTYGSLNTEYYIDSPVWLFNGNSTSITYQEDRFSYVYSGYPMETSNFYFTLKRRPLHFLINSIFPCLVLNTIMLLAFGLPAVAQFTISMSVFFTFSIYSLRIVTDIPVQSMYVPDIQYYFFASTFFTLSSLAWFILDNLFRTMNYLPGALAIVGHGLRRIGDLSFLARKKIKPTRQTGMEKNATKIANNEISIKVAQQESQQNPIGKAKSIEKNTEIKDPLKALEANLSDDSKKIDQDLKRNRRELELNVTALNRLVFVLELLGMLTCNLVLWTYLNFA